MAAHSDDESEGAIVERQPAPFQDPVENLGKEQMMTALWSAVDQLSAQQRSALLLQVQEELPTAEIATVLKCSEATVRVHLHRALNTLRKLMGNV